MRSIFSACFIVLSFILTGCATMTHVSIKDDAVFPKYKKIYLAKFKEDPRNILPEIQVRLEKLGFEVILSEEDEPVGGRQGTGFIISSDGYFLTAAHVIGKQKEATIWLDGKRYEAELIYKEESADDTEADSSSKNATLKEEMDAALNSSDNRSVYEDMNKVDLALLKIKSSGDTFKPLSIAKDPQYRMGQDVYTIGFPLSQILGDKPRLNKGLVSSDVGMKDSPNFVQVSVEIQPGNSGGPLLNEAGQLVGVILMTLDPMTMASQTGGALPQNVNFAVKNTMLREFLNNVPETSRPVLVEDVVMPFDDVQHSVIQVRSGIVSEDFRKDSGLVCVTHYSYIWDIWYRFTLLDVIFYDMDTQETLLRAGQYGDDMFSSEKKTLDRTFKEIAKKMGREMANDAVLDHPEVNKELNQGL